MVFDLSRRKLLAGLGFASLPATATIALATAPVVIAEVPELLEIGRQLAILEAELPRVEQERADAVAHYDATKPDVPQDLICPEYLDVGIGGRMRNPDLRLAERLYDSVHDTRNDYYQFFSHLIRDEIASIPPRGRSARLKALHRILAQAEEHEAACEAAWREFCDRVAMYARVRSGVEKLASRVQHFEARTMVGVTIKARAICALSRVRSGEFEQRAAALQIGPGLAADIVRLGASQP